MTDQNATEDGWNEVETAIRSDFLKNARMHKLVPNGPEMPGAYTVPIFEINTGKASRNQVPAIQMKTDLSAPVITLACSFSVRSDQQNDKDIVLDLARFAARRLAVAEDLVIAFGSSLVSTDALTSLNVEETGLTSEEHPKGLPANRPLGLFHCPEAAGGDCALAAIQNGVTSLQSSAADRCFGPYASILLPQLWNDAITNEDNGIARCKAVLESSYVQPVPLPAGLQGFENKGVVFAHDNTAFDLIRVALPHIPAPPQRNGGSVLYRVEASFYFRVRNIQAGRVISLQAD